VALELAEELDALGHQNRVLALGLGLEGRRDPDLQTITSRVSVGPDVLALCAWRFHRLVTREPVDVVLAHGGWAAQVAAAGMPRNGPRLVWQRILGFPPEVYGPLRRLWWGAVCRRVDVAVALTSDLEDELRRLDFCGPVWIIPNARQPTRFVGVDRAEAAADLRSELSVPPGRALLGLVGHLVVQKRPERALDVLADVLAGGRCAHLVLAGDGPLRPSLERAVEQRQLQEHVSFLGHRSDVEKVLGGLDLLLLTSQAEGIPGVVIEAVMTGCPVVTFPLGGVAEVVEDGVTGVVLPTTDTALMAQRVIELLDDPERRRRMSEEARKRTPEFAAGKIARLYAEQLAELVRS
jgi:glycosyltransferase involved in cell wall biosynthesis